MCVPGVTWQVVEGHAVDQAERKRMATTRQHDNFATVAARRY